MNIGRILKIRAKAKKYTCAHKKLSTIPGDCISLLENIEDLELQGNCLKELPQEFSSLTKLKSLNLGLNVLEIVPEVINELEKLEKLSLYKNQLYTFSGGVLCRLQNLRLLNINSNNLSELPPAIGQLHSLQSLSVEHNQLEYLPDEICNVSTLTELRLSFNKLQYLPYLMGNLSELKILSLTANRLRELPETFGNLVSLVDLDVAGNCISYFPNNFDSLKLREFYCENNNLVAHEPVFSYQEPVVFSLKELSARILLKELRKRGSRTARVIFKMPKIYELLSASGQCAVCRNYFLHTWLECVRFVDSRFIMGTINNAGQIPIRAQVCSYKCFNNRSNDLYGVARL